MNDVVNTFEDNGGVHINAGIPNHAFYQTAVRLGGFAWEKAVRIRYDALLSPQVRLNTGFRRFARITGESAMRLFGPASAEYQSVRAGWAEVGITILRREPMRVQFSTSGGIAYFPGLAKPVTIDCADLPQEEAEELQRLVGNANFFNLPSLVGIMRKGAADIQQHMIRVEHEGKSNTVRVAEPVNDPTLQKLVAKLRQVSSDFRSRSLG